MLNNTDVRNFGFKIGPSLKLRGLIEGLKQQQDSLCLSTDAVDKSQADAIIGNESNGSADAGALGVGVDEVYIYIYLYRCL